MGHQTDAGRAPDVELRSGPCARWGGNGQFLQDVLARVGDKWSVLVIGTLREGPIRYSALNDDIPGISQRMLTLTLKQLEREGLVTRTAYAEVPPRVEYALTSLGATLLDLVLGLVDWAAVHREEIEDSRARYDTARVTAS